MEEEAAAAPKRSHLRVLMLPWLAHGHLSPFLELAKRLSHNSIFVYLCSTSVNLDSIKQQLMIHKQHGIDNGEYSPAFPSIKLIELHLSNTSLQAPHLHTTKYLPTHLMPALKTAFDLSEQSFTQILRDVHPDLLIYDFIQPWAPRAANSLNIPAVLFLTTGAASTSFFYHYLNSRRHNFPFPEMSLSQSEDQQDNIKHIETTLLNRKANGITDAERLLECISMSSNFVAIKTFREIESNYMDYLSSLTGKELVPVGPLVPNTIDGDSESSRRLIQWLSNKDRSSVLFVSFGSEYFMEKEEIEEIARGLELSKVSFIWVVRYPEPHEEAVATGEKRVQLQGAAYYNYKELEGCGHFEEKIDDDKIGVIIEGWVPQREILSNTSIGGFLTHCGWSSVIEGMRFGVPILAMPLQLDQPLNANLVVELGVGVKIKEELLAADHEHAGYGATSTSTTSTAAEPKTTTTTNVGRRMFKRDEIAKVIRDVIGSEHGLGIKKKAKQIAELMGFKGNQEISFLVEKMALLCLK